MGGTKKEYCPLPAVAASVGGELTVLGAAVSAFAAVPAIKAIVIAVPADPAAGEAAARNALPPHLLAGKDGPAIHFVPGGATRRASVFNALSFLAAQELPVNIALIHDGARPWVSPALIQRVIDEAATHRAVIPLLPLTETPKEIDSPLDGDYDGPVLIKRHVKRAVVGAAQTPQGFAFPEILEAHRAAHQQAAAQDDSLHEIFTDDAEVWAEFCGRVAAIAGERENRKITFPEDNQETAPR
jgi:2-C-methyl-D-erythritol 4-phosphate cytidylyltransferase/2-C-methyl-D-erythritol 4-phosphate cytidylyltransferase/2-C-methyl-D-erythritol 2,4-cyclodiphosphate synthase